MGLRPMQCGLFASLTTAHCMGLSPRRGSAPLCSPPLGFAQCIGLRPSARGFAPVGDTLCVAQASPVAGFSRTRRVTPRAFGPTSLREGLPSCTNLRLVGVGSPFGATNPLRGFVPLPNTFLRLIEGLILRPSHSSGRCWVAS